MVVSVRRERERERHRGVVVVVVVGRGWWRAGGRLACVRRAHARGTCRRREEDIFLGGGWRYMFSFVYGMGMVRLRIDGG